MHLIAFLGTTQLQQRGRPLHSMTRGQQLLMLSLNKRLKSVHSLTPTKRRKTATEIMRPTAFTSSLVMSADALPEAAAAATDSEPQSSVGISGSVIKKKRPRTSEELTAQSKDKTAVGTEIMQPRTTTSSLVISAGTLSEATAAATDSEPQLNVGISNGVVKKRPRTSEEQIAASKEKHPLLPPCTNECRRKCCQKISPVRRADIHEQFWTQAYDFRRMWLFHHIVRVEVQRTRTAGENSRKPRQSSFRYKLPDDSGNEVFVCKPFFLHILGYASDKVVTCLMSATSPTFLSPNPSTRGKHKPPNCVDESVIIDHINSFNPQISHYRREHAPRRRYLAPEITIKFMFSDFESKYPKFCTYDKYRKVVQKLHISFCKLGEEECEFCIVNQNHKCGSTNDVECDECRKFVEHKALAAKVRQLYAEDKQASVSSKDHSFCSVDLQKVIMMPRLPGVKTAVFTRRLVVFHETFAPLKSLSNTISIVWHEAISGRRADDIASSFITAMKQESAVKHFTFWVDNCSAQNKNWTLYTAMVSYVNHESGPESITFKYLIAGHTFMSADAFHASVEKQLRKKKNLYDFDDFQQSISNTDKSVTVVPMDATDFHWWKSGTYRSRQSDRPLIASLHQVRFVKGSRDMQYKVQPDGDELQYSFLTKKFPLTEPPQKCNRGIPSVKKNEIVTKLCPLMPDDSKRAFWASLPVSDSVDLIDSDDVDDVDRDA